MIKSFAFILAERPPKEESSAKSSITLLVSAKAEFNSLLNIDNKFVFIKESLMDFSSAVLPERTSAEMAFKFLSKLLKLSKLSSRYGCISSRSTLLNEFEVLLKNSLNFLLAFSTESCMSIFDTICTKLLYFTVFQP